MKQNRMVLLLVLIVVVQVLAACAGPVFVDARRIPAKPGEVICR